MLKVKFRVAGLLGLVLIISSIQHLTICVHTQHRKLDLFFSMEGVTIKTYGRN